MSDIAICRRRPVSGEMLAGRCPECGHATMAHVGTDACPVCVLIELASPAGRRREARRMGVTIP